MAEDKPQGGQPQNPPDKPASAPKPTPDPSVTPPPLVIVQEGYTKVPKRKLPDPNVTPPVMREIQEFKQSRSQQPSKEGVKGQTKDK